MIILSPGRMAAAHVSVMAKDADKLSAVVLAAQRALRKVEELAIQR